jgi:hypothetical protein
LTTEQIVESKTKISAATELERIMTQRMKEITTLMGRATIVAAEKTKLTKEKSELTEKIEV